MTADSRAVAQVETPAAKPAPLLRERDYRGWWIGDTVSEFGSALSAFAYPLLILTITGSMGRAGVVGSATSVGALSTMLFGGALADRYPRRLLLVGGAFFQATVTGSVCWAVSVGHPALWYLAVAGLLQGMAGGLTGGAARPALRRVVAPGRLPAAFALMQGRTMAIRLTAPAVGGLLFSLARFVPFLVDACSFLAGALGVLHISRPLGPDVGEGAGRESLVSSIAAGLRYLRHDSYLRFVMIWAAVYNGVLSGLLLLLVGLVLARGGGPAVVGSVGSIAASGGLLGAFLATRVVRRFGGRAMVLALSWVGVVDLAAMGVAPYPWLIGVLFAFMQFFSAPINVVFATYEVRMIPDELTGRVSTAIDFGAASLRWIGPVAAGLAATHWGLTAATSAFSLVLAVLAVGTHLVRGLRVLDTPVDQIGTSGSGH